MMRFNKLHTSCRQLRAFLDITQSYGYNGEEHVVQTDDGYLLTLHRIPHGVRTRENGSKGIVFLQHGLLCSSVDWIVAGPRRSLPYLLAEQGYDVWMGNARGNTYSRRHVSLKPKSRDFWQFSWHEIGIYDLSAMIDYTLNKTGQTSLHYIGYSQGTTAFLVLASMRNDYNKKVSMFQALAPAVFLSNTKSPFIKALAPLASQTKFLLDSIGVHELFPSDTKIVQKVRKSLYRNNVVVQSLLTNILFIIAGFDSQQMDLKLLPRILENTPAGASVNQMIHYAQCINSGKFRSFDYGKLGNELKYGSRIPPKYPIEEITIPTVIHFAENDWLCTVEDVEKLIQKLPNVVGKYQVPFPKFNHLDFIYALQARQLVYENVLTVLKNTSNFRGMNRMNKG